jgi:hypothetical protein
VDSGLGADRCVEEVLGARWLVQGRSRTRGFERCLPAGSDDPHVRGTQRVINGSHAVHATRRNGDSPPRNVTFTHATRPNLTVPPAGGQSVLPRPCSPAPGRWGPVSNWANLTVPPRAVVDKLTESSACQSRRTLILCTQRACHPPEARVSRVVRLEVSFCRCLPMPPRASFTRA